MRITQKYLYLITFIATALVIFLCCLLVASKNRNEVMKNTLQNLETKIALKEQTQATAIATAGPGAATSSVDQKIKDLSTRFVGDARSLAEKLRDFTIENSDNHNLAIACKVIVDLAANVEALPDQDLLWLYQTQTNPEVQRVIAQVASFRGDNQLLNTYIKQLQTGLASASADERRKTLSELAKTRYTGAATLLLPLLKEADSSVVLDALLALRATGNESQLAALAPLIHHPDESIRWLAGDVINNLETLSKKARTHLLLVDIALELPTIVMP